jgi:TPR repeat protein
LGLAPALAFDGKPSPTETIMPTATEAFRTGANQLKLGEKAKAISSLQYAAEKGHALAQWKLGRMYAEGDGVPRDDLRAFDYFSRIADSHADESPQMPQAKVVAYAFVQLGHYYLDGIPNSTVKADPERAREMFSYAASYFGDADAQYQLARLYLDGPPNEKRQAVRWLAAAANKGQYRAQALLGKLLCQGDLVPRHIARGLMWLTLARESANADEDTWIREMQEKASQQASDEERKLAVGYLERYLKTRRE